jgi:glutamyl-tRNA synthetase
MTMKKGTTFRLMELYDVELTTAGAEPKAKYAGEELVREMKKLQWVTSEGVEVKVLEPGPLFNDEGAFNKDSLGEVKGVAEVAFASLKPGEIVQFPRFGFCRVDSARTCILA